MMCNIYFYSLAIAFQVAIPYVNSAEGNINFINGNHGVQNELIKGKRGVTGVVDTVHGHNVGVGHNVVPVPVPVHIPVPRPYPVGIPKPVGIPVGVPVAVRIAVPKPYPVPVLVDSGSTGLDYGLGIYGHSHIDQNLLLHYLARSGHFGHISSSGHEQHALNHYALAKFLH